MGHWDLAGQYQELKILWSSLLLAFGDFRGMSGIPISPFCHPIYWGSPSASVQICRWLCDCPLMLGYALRLVHANKWFRLFGASRSSQGIYKSHIVVTDFSIRLWTAQSVPTLRRTSSSCQCLESACIFGSWECACHGSGEAVGESPRLDQKPGAAKVSMSMSSIPDLDKVPKPQLAHTSCKVEKATIKNDI